MYLDKPKKNLSDNPNFIVGFNKNNPNLNVEIDEISTKKERNKIFFFQLK